jgi:hypothetical protein
MAIAILLILLSGIDLCECLRGIALAEKTRRMRAEEPEVVRAPVA